jgi:hypothetical protein
MAAVASEVKGLHVNADTHLIEISGPVDRLDALLKEGLLSIFEYGDEDEDGK